jgi:hypothetical protein
LRRSTKDNNRAFYATDQLEEIISCVGALRARLADVSLLLPLLD